MRLTTPLLLVALAAATVPLTAGSAAADPKGDQFSLSCDNGRTYVISVNGNGEFTPAHDTGSTTVFVPTSFHGSTFTLTDADGNVVDQGTDDAVAVKGRSERSRATSVSCTYTGSETFVDPELGELTATFTGGVDGFATPVR
jgi:hypothetical protein